MLRKKFLSAFAFILCVGVVAPLAIHAHCQVPCGIYDDHARLQRMLEDAATVRKATTLIVELTDKTDDPQAQNQITRWVLNKETHAQNVISTISDYFLTQRVKPSQTDYTERLEKHHAVIIAAMKAKQNADSSFADTLTERIKALEVYYPAPKHTH